MSKLTLATDGETQIVIKRRFKAPPEAVWRAHMEPALLQKWLLGPDGWTMPVCINDAKPGGKFRYEWVNGEGHGFYITGEFEVLEAPSRIVHVERMFLPDRTPDNRVETRFLPDGEGGTQMIMTMTLPDSETRATMLATGMAKGMEDSYARLEGII